MDCDLRRNIGGNFALECTRHGMTNAADIRKWREPFTEKDVIVICRISLFIMSQNCFVFAA